MTETTAAAAVASWTGTPDSCSPSEAPEECGEGESPASSFFEPKLARVWRVWRYEEASLAFQGAVSFACTQFGLGR